MRLSLDMGLGSVVTLNQGVGVVAPEAAYLPAGAGTPMIAFGSRKMISAYAGSLIRVKKGGDGGTTFDVPVLANGLNDDAAAIAWAAGSEMRIAIAYDQSGNGRNFVPAAWADMPLYDPAALYGSVNKYGAFNSIIFDGWFETPSTRRLKWGRWTGLNTNRRSLSIFDVVDPKSALYNASYWDFATAAAPTTTSLGIGTAAASNGLYASGFTNDVTGRRPRQNMQVIGVASGATNNKVLIDGQIVSLAAKGSVVEDSLNLGVGASGAAGTSDFLDSGNRLAFVVYPTTLSDANAQAVRDALNSTFGLATASTAQIIVGGDSNHFGPTITGSQQNRTITREIRKLLLGADFYSMALSSQQLMGAGGQIASAATREDLLLADGSYTDRILVSLGGGNDLAVNGGTPGFGETLYNAHAAYIADERTAGATGIVVGTIPPRSTFTSGQHAIEWADYNSRIRAGKAGADRVADLEAHFTGERANFANSTYWQGDSVHWTGLVNHELAPIIVTELNALL